MYYLKGRLAMFAYMAADTYYQVNQEEGDTINDAWEIAKFTAGTVFLFLPEIRFVGPAVTESVLNAAGRLAWAAAKSPVGIALQASAILYIGGGLLANKIDPVSGVDRYIGFTTGGIYGEQDINYWSGDANDTGYFNAPENISIIAGHYYGEARKSAGRAEEKALTRWQDFKRQFQTRPTWANF